MTGSSKHNTHLSTHACATNDPVWSHTNLSQKDVGDVRTHQAPFSSKRILLPQGEKMDSDGPKQGVVVAIVVLKVGVVVGVVDVVGDVDVDANVEEERDVGKVEVDGEDELAVVDVCTDEDDDDNTVVDRKVEVGVSHGPQLAWTDADRAGRLETHVPAPPSMPSYCVKLKYWTAS